MAYYNNPYQYNPNFYQQQQQNFTPQQQAYVPQQNVSQQQVQNGGFVNVRSETEARNYPVALGNVVTFKDETAPYIYTKTMGFSPLDIPRFEIYKQVPDPSQEQQQVEQRPQESEIDSVRNEMNNMKQEISALWQSLDELKNDRVKSNNTTKKPARNEKGMGDRRDE